MASTLKRNLSPLQNARSFLALVSSCLLLLFTLGLGSAAAQEAGKDAPAKDAPAKDAAKADNEPVIPKDSTTQGTVNVGGHTIDYQAIAGTILVAATNDADASLGINPSAAKKPQTLPPRRAFFEGLFSRNETP